MPFLLNLNYGFSGLCYREAEYKNSITKLEETVNEITMRRCQLEEECQSSGFHIEQLRNTVFNYKNEIESLQTLLTVEKKDLTEKRKLNENLKTEIDSYKIKFDEYITNKEIMKDEITRTKCQVESLSKENFSLNNDLQEFRQKLNNITQEMKIVKEDNKVLTEEIKKKDNEIHAILNDGKNIETCFQQRLLEFQKLKERSDKLCRENKKIETTKVDLQKQIDELEKTRKVDNEKKEQLEEKINQCQYLFVENDEKFQQLSRQYSKLQHELKEKDRELNSLTEQVKSLTTANLEKTKKLESTTLENLELKQNLENLANEKEIMRVKLSDKLTQVTTIMQDEQCKIQNELNSKNEVILELQEKLKASDENLTSSKMQHHQMKERINFLNSKNEYLIQDIERLNNEKEGLQKQKGKEICI